MLRNLFLIPAGALMLMQVGCSATQERALELDSVAERNQQLAAELTHQASGLIESDPDEAMRLLRLAVEADLFHGPAHNNIGVILLNQGMLYEAAEEFDWARRLMPGHPDPRVNLGLALERGGKYGDALEAYASAMEVYPGHLPSVKAFARLQVRAGLRDDWTNELLSEIVNRGDTEWQEWARMQLFVD